jgi:hypothetical protein
LLFRFTTQTKRSLLESNKPGIFHRHMLMEECVRRSPGAIRVNNVSIYTSKIARCPTPPTLLNLQGISLFSNKLGSVGGVGGATGWAGRFGGVPGSAACRSYEWRSVGTAKMTSAGLPVSRIFGLWIFGILGPKGQRPWNLIFGAKVLRSIMLWSFGIDPARCSSCERGGYEQPRFSSNSREPLG